MADRSLYPYFSDAPKGPPIQPGVGVIHTATDGRDILRNTPDGWEVEAPWIWWDGPAGGDGTGGPFGNPPPGAEMFAPTMEGLSLPAVTRCVQLLADKIAGMPWPTVRDGRQVPAPTWITDPQNLSLDGRRTDGGTGLDVRLSAVEFWQQVIVSYLNWGEGIIYTPRLPDPDTGEPSGPIVAPLYVLHPKFLDVHDGQYWVRSDMVEEGWERLDPREIIVVRNIMRPGRERGLGVIQAHAADLALAARIRGYEDNMFQRGIPNGYLYSDKPDLTPEQVAKLKKQWLSAHGGIHKSIAILNATTHFQALDLDPQAVQMVELLRLQAWQVCLMYGVPPSKLGISLGQQNTYSNLESENAAFVQDSLLPIARKLEAAIDSALPAGTTLKINFSSLLRADTTTRYAAYKTAIEAGIMTVEEVRALEDLPPADTAPATVAA